MPAGVLFKNVDLFVEHIIKINASKMYYMVLYTTVLCTVHGQVICIITCNAPIMDNPEIINILMY